jgi:hypothetical protein
MDRFLGGVGCGVLTTCLGYKSPYVWYLMGISLMLIIISFIGDNDK